MEATDTALVKQRTVCSVQRCKNILDPKSSCTTCGVCRETWRARYRAMAAKQREAKAKSLANGHRQCSRPYCSKPAESPRFAVCLECRRTHRKASRENIKRHREQGKCITCTATAVGRSCFCFKHAVRSAITGLRQNARYRNIEVTITNDHVTALILNECFYCGQPPNPINGVDRLVNERGYHVENCCACCGPCNYMKGRQHADEFLDRCARTSRRLEYLSLEHA